jgi:hypothetical protein
MGPRRVFERLQELLLDELGAAGALDWSRVTVDSFSLRAARGGPGRRNPVDRAKPGSKLHLAAEGTGLPLSLLVTAANTPDAAVFSRRCWTTSPRCGPLSAVGAAAPRRFTPTRPTISAAAAATLPSGGSRSASPAVGSSRRSGWVATAGRPNARSPGWLGVGDCGSAMTGTPGGSSPSPCWAAHGWATTGFPIPPRHTHGHPDRGSGMSF